MSISSLTTTASQESDELERLRAEFEALREEHEDLRLLYEATIEHGEAVEDQLAEKNALLERTQARLNAELADAANYVMSILPSPRRNTPATDWLLVPSTELGGDSFGYHEIDADHLGIYLIDVCGHGVGAALLSVTVMNVLRASSLPGADFRNPSSVLAALNDSFPMERQNNMFFTCWYGVWRRSTGLLTFASGGHPPAIHLPAGEPGGRLLGTPGGMAIGALPDVSYTSASAELRPGDRLLVLSDGTFEVEDSGGTMLGLDALVDYCATHSDRPDDIFAWIREFNGGATLPDDFSLLRVAF